MRTKKISTLATHATHPMPPFPEHRDHWSAEQIQTMQHDAALSLRREIIFHNSLKDGGAGPEMVIIPAGTFLMGSPENEEDRFHDEHQHKVTIARPFAMGQYAVTFAEYDKFCDAIGQKKPPDAGWGRGQRPVINLSWNDALDYCEWLYEQTGHSYWLPTEAEWEYACRAGTVTPFNFGATVTHEQVHYENVRLEKTIEVGSLPANAFGLYEMHGNVWEWTCSEYHQDYAGAESECSNNKCDFGLRVYRGGSWFNKLAWIRSAARSHRRPEYHHNTLGFRVSVML